MTYKLLSITTIFDRKPDPKTGEIKEDIYRFQASHPSFDNRTIGDPVEDIWIERRLVLEDLDTMKSWINKQVIFDVVPQGRITKYVGISLAP